MTINTQKDKHFHPDSVCGAGTLPNDKVPMCKICRRNGFPHEPVIFKPFKGRILADGSTETVAWKVFDYFQPWRQHQHKTKKDGC